MGSWHHFFFNTIDGINNKLWCTDKQPKHFYQTLHRTSALLREWNQQGEVRCILPTRPLVTVHLSHSHEDSLTHVGPQHYPARTSLARNGRWRFLSKCIPSLENDLKQSQRTSNTCNCDQRSVWILPLLKAYVLGYLQRHMFILKSSRGLKHFKKCISFSVFGLPKSLT